MCYHSVIQLDTDLTTPLPDAVQLVVAVPPRESAVSYCQFAFTLNKPFLFLLPLDILTDKDFATLYQKNEIQIWVCAQTEAPLGRVFWMGYLLRPRSYVGPLIY